MAAPATIVKGLSTIHWGTFNTSNVTNAVVTRIGLTRKNGSPIEIEDQNGFSLTEVLLNDGFDASVTILAQSANMNVPNVGDYVLLHLPHIGASTNCLVVACPEVDMERKREATVTMKVTNRPQVNA
jgi:hypothetical protein